MKLKDLPIGARVYDPDTKYQGKPIIWVIADKNHPGYPDNSVTLMSDNILCSKAFDAKERIGSPDNRNYYGYNNWKDSNLRQWLNSNDDEWYSDLHEYDMPPNIYCVTSNPYVYEKGFLTNFSDRFFESLLETTLKTPIYSTDKLGSIEETHDKIFLVTSDEVGLNDRNDKSDNSKLALFDNNVSRQAYPILEIVRGGDRNSEHFIASKSYNYWLRDANCGNSYLVHSVYSDGSLDNNDAYSGDGGVRVFCNLKLDILVLNEPDENGVYKILFSSTDTSDNKNENIIIKESDSTYTDHEIDRVIDLFINKKCPDKTYTQNEFILWMRIALATGVIGYKS